MPVNTSITFRKGSATQWSNTNPVLASGEPGYDLTNNILKIGDGVSAWNSLNNHQHTTSNISGLNSTATELNYLQGVTPGTGIANKALVLDSVGSIQVPLLIQSYGVEASFLYAPDSNILNIASNSGSFNNSLKVNNIPVSVSGHTHLSSDITNFNSSVSGLLPSNIVTGVGTSGYLSRWNDTNTLTSGIIFESDNRIGIVNTNPESILHIKDSTPNNTWLIVENTNIANNTNVGLMLKDTYGASAPSSGLIYNDWPGAGMVFVASRDLADNQGGFVFRGANGTDRMVIRTNTNGNVGIGTSAPAYKLDVAGNVRTSGNHFITNNLGVGTVLPSGQLHVIGTGIISSRLGVNTSSPTTPLHVIGTGLIASTTGLPANALLDVYSTTSGEMVFNVEGTNGSLFSVIDNLSGSLMSVNNNAGLPIFEVFSDDSIIAGRFNQNDFVISSGGNIGIGKAAPSVKLDIVGGVAISGAFAATTKSFKIDHPSKSNYTLEYGSLESPYHGVRLTGRGVVSKGRGIVELPDYLKHLIHDDDTINIQLTNLYHDKILYVSDIDLANNKFEVCAKRAKTLSDLEFCWTFTGIRKDVDYIKVESMK